MQGSFLIVGKPGTGKSTTLLELAKEIILKAKNNKDIPVPVIFNLSRWNQKQDMLNWLIEELKEQYKVKESWSRRWISEGLILLLDGLDELEIKHQTACVHAINQLSCRFKVVCCREETYSNLPKLKLNGAVRLKPLTESQIANHLTDLPLLKKALAQHKLLRDLADSPLILNILVRIYAESPLDDEVLAGQTSSTLQAHLFDAYIDRMFNRIFRVVKRSFPKEDTINRLSWLAQTMKKNRLSVFLIEEMQPSWLPTRSRQQQYFILSRASLGLILGSWLALFIDWSRIDFQLAFTMLITVTASTVGGIVAGILENRMAQKDKIDNRSPQRQSVQKALYIGIPVMMVVQFCWLLGSLLSVSFFWDQLLQSPGGSLLTSFIDDNQRHVLWGTDLLTRALSGLFNAVAIGCSFGLLSPVRYLGKSLSIDIQMVEKIKVAPYQMILKSAHRWSLGGIGLGLIFATIFGLIGGLGGTYLGYQSGLFSDLSGRQVVLAAAIFTLIAIFISVFISAIFFGVLGALVGGMISSGSSTRLKSNDVAPNEGVRRSSTNAFRTGIIALGVSWLISGFVFYWLISSMQMQTGIGVGLIGSFTATLSLAVTSGLFVGLWYGGLSVIKHYTLRFLLWRENKLPRNVVEFLEHGVDLILLQRGRTDL